MFVDLLLPTALSAIALFFASFVSWMVVPIHRKDWVKFAKEDELMDAIRKLEMPQGNYMFPGCESPEHMKSEEYAQKWNAGPCGILSIYPTVSMGKNLGLTFVFFLVVSFLLGVLASMRFVGVESPEFMEVFQFVGLAGLLTFLSAILQHAIWFHARVIGHIIESIAYAVITAAIFASLWPSA